ncbi:MAG: HDIG domain-containing protein [Defluviitaleaceae bacterium]|nr:HDIG domain-containing protein [Defluviitaleaceae bacterium]
MNKTRDDAYKLLCQYNESEALINHALAVEATMRHFAEKMGEDVEYWGHVGLLHDLDYEKYPEEHCKKVVELLEAAGYDEKFIHAVVSHGYGLCADVEPEHIMEKVLYTIDELTGLINAAALMRPSKSVTDLEYKSLLKKYKTKSFAAGVNRDVIENGCNILGWELKYAMEETIDAMRKVHESIGL